MTDLNYIKLRGKFLKEVYTGRTNKLWLFKPEEGQFIVLAGHRSLTIDTEATYDIAVNLFARSKKNSVGVEIFHNNIDLIDIKKQK